ncbi:MAG: hypothetical protein QNJ97_09775 [Myxococcota bacterium]|nr:hypothetical protein [Myxococcota bacterium]
MFRLLAKLICLGVAGAASWMVFTNLTEIFQGWIPLIGGSVVLLCIFPLLYFPLARPIADIIADRVAVLFHRGRHIRTGSGLDDIPEAPPQPSCSICGEPGGPICATCTAKMERSQKPR